MKVLLAGAFGNLGFEILKQLVECGTVHIHFIGEPVKKGLYLISVICLGLARLKAVLNLVLYLTPAYNGGPKGTPSVCSNMIIPKIGTKIP